MLFKRMTGDTLASTVKFLSTNRASLVDRRMASVSNCLQQMVNVSRVTCSPHLQLGINQASHSTLAIQPQLSTFQSIIQSDSHPCIFI
ncbi:unnamed protein product [Protopolystoma xenopodis]|uniref:Uncharacterized protein n=1 Tax=Protopolystoma xenopodis TaxID=117903 RepID=A0A448XC48_9PLAT|nr:unnamed protein product [Protopolystoma xenopodis]